MRNIKESVLNQSSAVSGRVAGYIYEFLDLDAAQSLVNEHLKGKENRRLLIRSLLSVEEWCEKFLT